MAEINYAIFMNGFRIPTGGGSGGLDSWPLQNVLESGNTSVNWPIEFVNTNHTLNLQIGAGGLRSEDLNNGYMCSFGSTDNDQLNGVIFNNIKAGVKYAVQARGDLFKAENVSKQIWVDGLFSNTTNTINKAKLTFTDDESLITFLGAEGRETEFGPRGWHFFSPSVSVFLDEIRGFYITSSDQNEYVGINSSQFLISPGLKTIWKNTLEIQNPQIAIILSMQSSSTSLSNGQWKYWDQTWANASTGFPLQITYVGESKSGGLGFITIAGSSSVQLTVPSDSKILNLMGFTLYPQNSKWFRLIGDTNNIAVYSYNDANNFAIAGTGTQIVPPNTCFQITLPVRKNY